MRPVDGGIGAVHVVREQPVADLHGSAGWRDAPVCGRDLLHGQDGVPLAACLEHVHVLAELVGRVAARRRPRHPHLERRPGRGGESDVHLQPALLGRGYRDDVLDGGLRIREPGRQCRQQGS